MSKMKHLLRKLHIGGGLNDQPPLRLAETRPGPVVPATTNPSPNSNPYPSSSSDSISAAMGRFGAVEPGPDRAAGVGAGGGDGGGCVDFNFLEEEFQVQLALAISASDPDAREAREDPESAQIDAAKRMSLGCSASNSTADSEALLSLQYWSYNVVNYDEKLMDGFYDVHGVTSTSVTQGKMPLLVDLQAVSILDNVNYDVILVNCSVDPHLQQLEREACTISMECRYSESGISGLIQKVADMVVNRMGGPVGDADGMLKRWSIRRSKLRNSLNSIVLPLGRLDVGLSRHRALLFKVLADRINLPCMLVKGSYYTGTDDGAVNLIKMGNGSEYIIDLMGAPGALIPAEVPTTHLLNSGLEIRSFSDSVETLEASCLVPEKETGASVVSSLHDTNSEGGNMLAGTASSVDIQRKDDKRKLVKETSTKKFENEFGRLLPSLHNSGEGSSGTCGKASPAEKMQVKNVSKYVLSASKHPEFAQKLHAVLLESGAPQHLLESGTPQQYDGEYLPFTLMQPANLIDFDGEQKQTDEHSSEKPKELGMKAVQSNFYLPSVTTSEEVIAVRRSDGMNGADAACLGDSSQSPHLNDLNVGKKCAAKLRDTTSTGVLIEYNGLSEKINFGENAEWEISWEDLQIGERIGIGSYGEVYHADWNGTEVAVKKFLDQDFSGDSLVQFKSEVEIMLRLRHPNVVLFMGAVTRSPHFSILTEFLPRGSLYRLIHRPNQLDERRRMRMALDVAKGMNYLHTSHPTIVHRDLKSPNLLVDKNWVVKVCDFGLSRTKHHTFLSSKSTAGTPEWMAPEVLRNEPANEKCDVYSFGVILWELATLQIPWKGLNPMQVVGAVGFQHRRLEIPEHIDPTVAQIIRDCWLTEPHLRPSFSQLMQRLRRLQHLVVGRTESRNLME